jgi:hypothetical protein
MKEVTSYHFQFTLVGASGPVVLGDADEVKVTPHVRKSTRKPRGAAPVTSVQGYDPFDISFKRGMYNGALQALLDASMSPLTAPSLSAVATITYPDAGTVEQYLFTGIVLADGPSVSSSADSTDEEVSFTADKRVKLS